MTARFLVGDVFDRLAEIPDGTVDLVLTSPPFLALRSYLPAGHPDKAKEIGSEATPAEFLDTLLELTAEWGRVLAPHGSIAVELGDTFSGSGGAGGDYTDTGWRAGQERFGGSASRANTREARWSLPQATWLAGILDAEGCVLVRRQESQRSSPNYQAQVRVTMMDRQVCDRAADITGVGGVAQDSRGAFSWSVSGQQARYVLTNIWPYLLIKQRQALAAIELQRHIEEKRRRGKYDTLAPTDIEYRQMIREFVMGLNGRGDQRGVYVPTWDPPRPRRIKHSLAGACDGWPLDKSLCGIPQLYAVGLAYGFNPLTGEPSPAGMWRVRNVKPWIRSNPPVGALGDKERPATSYVVVATRARDRYFDLDAVRTGHAGRYHERTTNAKAPGNRAKMSGDRGGSNFGCDPAGAPPRDWWHHVDAVLDACLDEMNGKTGGGVRGKVPKGRMPGSGSDVENEGDFLSSGNRIAGARGVHLRRALEAAGILTTLEALDVSPKGYSGKLTTTRREPVSAEHAHAYGVERTASPDCPVHADRPGQPPTAPRGGRAEARSPRTSHTGDHLVLELPLDSGTSGSTHGHSGSPPGPTSEPSAPQCSPAATPRSTASNRTAPAPATTPPGNASGRSPARIGDTSTSPPSDAPNPDTMSSRTGEDDQPSPGHGTPDDSADTSGQLSACTCSFHKLVTESTSHYAVWPPELVRLLVDEMCPRRVCTTCGQPSRRITEGTVWTDGGERERDREGRGRKVRDPERLNATGDGRHGDRCASPTTVGWSTCGCPGTDATREDGFHNGGGWRPGLVLDPFAGSGTTLAVASGMGRESIGIDLDERNAELARERVGMFLDVEPALDYLDTEATP